MLVDWEPEVRARVFPRAEPEPEPALGVLLLPLLLPLVLRDAAEGVNGTSSKLSPSPESSWLLPMVSGAALTLPSASFCAYAAFASSMVLNPRCDAPLTPLIWSRTSSLSKKTSESDQCSRTRCRCRCSDTGLP